MSTRRRNVLDPREVLACDPAKPRLRESLHENESLLRRAAEERDRLFNQSLDLLCIIDFDGRLAQVNPAWTRILGWSESELVKRLWSRHLHPDDRTRLAEASRALVRGDSLLDVEIRYQCKDGSWRWLSWTGHPVLETRQIFAVARDVTERRKTDEALRTQAALIDNAQRLAGMGSWQLDLRSRLLTWSDATCDIFGIHPGKFRGTFEHFRSSSCRKI